jgi:hypothetical protein
MTGTSDGKYRIIYFGESENLSQRGFLAGHHQYECFLKQAGSENNLYIGTYEMPNSTQDDRRNVEQSLIRQYDPVCNR